MHEELLRSDREVFTCKDCGEIYLYSNSRNYDFCENCLPDSSDEVDELEKENNEELRIDNEESNLDDTE